MVENGRNVGKIACGLNIIGSCRKTKFLFVSVANKNVRRTNPFVD